MEITNEIKEYLYHLNYKKYTNEEIFQILLITSLYSYANYGRTAFCIHQRGTKEKDVKVMINYFIEHPISLQEIEDNIIVHSKKKEIDSYFISKSDLISLNYSINMFGTKLFNDFFQNNKIFKFEDTFDIYQNLDKTGLELINISKEHLIESVEFLNFKESEYAHQKK